MPHHVNHRPDRGLGPRICPLLVRDRRRSGGSPGAVCSGLSSSHRPTSDHGPKRRLPLPRNVNLRRGVALAGGLLGIVSGPIAMFSYMLLEGYLHGTTFLGLELLAAPILGVCSGTLEGVSLGAIRAYMATRPCRLTIARLMLVVAISGPSLAFFVAFPPMAMLALINLMLLLPVAIVVMVAVEMHQEEKSRSARTGAGRTPSCQPEDEIDGLGVRFSDWGDPDLLKQETR